MYAVVRAIQTLFSVYSTCLIARAFLEMVLGPYHAAVVFLRRITEPVLAPIRRFVPPLRSGAMAWDLSPIVALVLLWLIERIVVVVLLSVG